MPERRDGKASSKRPKPSTEQIVRTPDYEAMLADIVAMIRAARKRGPIRPRITLRSLHKSLRNHRKFDAEGLNRGEREGVGDA